MNKRDQIHQGLLDSMTRLTSNYISINYTLTPAQKAIEIIRKSYKDKYPDMPINMLWAELALNGEIKGVIVLSPIHGNTWTAHIASTYPLLGRSLLRTCEIVLRKCVDRLKLKTMLLFPDNKLASNLATKLGFRISETSPLIMIRNFINE